MIPVSQYTEGFVEVVSMPSYTYHLDFDKKRITGKIDGSDAVKQAVYKVLNTERFAYVIYSALYGFEFDSLIGRNKSYAMDAIKGRIRDALMVDDRINDITSLKIENNKNDESISISFDVVTDYGSIQISTEAAV